MPSALARVVAMGIATGLFLACQPIDRNRSHQAAPTASQAESTLPEGIHPRTVDSLIAEAEYGVVAVNRDGDVAVHWLPPLVDDEEEQPSDPRLHLAEVTRPAAVTVTWSSGAVSTFALDDADFEVVGVPGGFVLEQPTSVTREPILVRADGSVAALREVPRPTPSVARALEKRHGWSFDPEELTWWQAPSVPADDFTLVDDQGRAWYLESFSPLDGVVVTPAKAHVEWGPAGTDLHHMKTQEHLTPAVNGSLVVLGDRVAIVNGEVIDQSRDNGRTWRATPMDNRWRGMFFTTWFANDSGRLFRSPPDGSQLMARSVDDSWTTFEAVTLPMGFTNVQVAGDLLWAVRDRDIGNRQLPGEVAVSDDDGDSWNRITLPWVRADSTDSK